MEIKSPKTIFSGIQPSGNLHLGNYLGAIKNWVAMQHEYNSIFCVVDLHAITVPQNPEELQKKILEVAKIYLAAGIDPQKSTIFVQSQVPGHSELMWILNTITKISELRKMTQFRDKSEKKGILAGLLNYPILMAADILLFDTDVVPVGEDQLQHIELARTIANRFNRIFGETFRVPGYFVKKEGMRITSLGDPRDKMSKSDPVKNNSISLLDSPDQIREKIKRAVTDNVGKVQYQEDQPAIKNLLNIFSLISDKSIEELEKEYADKNYGRFKTDLAEATISFLEPFQKNYQKITDAEVRDILEQGRKNAAKIAEEKMKEVKEKVGLGVSL